jgi:hypothetical protein
MGLFGGISAVLFVLFYILVQFILSGF